MNRHIRVTAAFLAVLPLICAARLARADSKTSNGTKTFHITTGNRMAPHKHPRHGAKSTDTHEIERVQYTFQKITVSNVDAGKSSKDDWTIGTGNGNGKHRGKPALNGRPHKPKHP